MATRPLRLVVIAHRVVSGDGQGRVNLEIARRALGAGHGVHVIAVDVDPDLLRAGASADLLRGPRWPALARVVWFVHAANGALDRRRATAGVDVAIANGNVISRPHELNLCQFVHAAWLATREMRDGRGPVDRAYQQVYTRYNARRERAVYATARRIVTPSRRTAAELAGIGISADRVSVIANGVDLDEFQPGPADRAALGLPTAGPLLLFAGDLRTNRKGLRFVLQAVQRLPHVQLAVVGRSGGSQFVPYARELGIAGRVTFLDYRRDVPRIMRACDLFVFPSGYEPYGMVVSEALASGLPVITSAVTGASELIDPSCGTVLDDASDVTALTAAIAAWTDPPSQTTAARDACRRAVSGLGWDTMAEAYLGLAAGLAPA